MIFSSLRYFVPCSRLLRLRKGSFRPRHDLQVQPIRFRIVLWMGNIAGANSHACAGRAAKMAWILPSLGKGNKSIAKASQRSNHSPFVDLTGNFSDFCSLRYLLHCSKQTDFTFTYPDAANHNFYSTQPKVSTRPAHTCGAS